MLLLLLLLLATTNILMPLCDQLALTESSSSNSRMAWVRQSIMGLMDMRAAVAAAMAAAATTTTAAAMAAAATICAIYAMDMLQQLEEEE